MATFINQQINNNMEKLEIRLAEAICDCVENGKSQLVIDALRACLMSDITCKLNETRLAYFRNGEQPIIRFENGQRFHLTSLSIKDKEVHLNRFKFDIGKLAELSTKSLILLSNLIQKN